MASELNDAKGTVDSTNAANLPPTGYGPDSPQAKEAIARLDEIKRIRTSGVGFTAKSAILGGAAGANAAKGSLDPVSAFMQGAAAGLQIPSMLAQQKKDQLTSAMDAAPLSISFPEIAAKYEYLAGMPTKLAIQTIQQIAIDTQKLAMTSQLREKEAESAMDRSMIKTEADALPYVNMANQVYGEGTFEAKDLVNMRREDVDNMIKLRTGSGADTDSTRLTDIYEKAPGNLAAEFGLPDQRVNPYHKMPQKVYEKVKGANAVIANKTITEAMDTASKMDVVINSLKKATMLLAPTSEGGQGLETGPITGRIPGRRLGAAAQEFDQIAKTILPSMRQGMPGAVSDRDMAIFKEANFGLEKDEEINKRIVMQQKLIAERIGARAEFLSNWATVYGDMAGSEAKWAEYIRMNPLFKNDGTPMGNSKTPKEYFGGDKAPEPTAIPEGTTGKAKDGTPVVRKGGKWVAQ